MRIKYTSGSLSNETCLCEPYLDCKCVLSSGSRLVYLHIAFEDRVVPAPAHLMEIVNQKAALKIEDAIS